jgi:hypothetical protein
MRRFAPTSIVGEDLVARLVDFWVCCTSSRRAAQTGSPKRKNAAIHTRLSCKIDYLPSPIIAIN